MNTIKTDIIISRPEFYHLKYHTHDLLSNLSKWWKENKLHSIFMKQMS